MKSPQIIILSLATMLATTLLWALPNMSGRKGNSIEFRHPDQILNTQGRGSDRALVIDNQNRHAVALFYKLHYEPYTKIPNQWTGDTRSCKIGRNSDAYQDATLKLLQYYRAMAGVPADVSFAEKYNAPARAAALIMESKNDLSHNPPANWPCYSAAGKKGAGSSNLCLGCVGPDAITAYVQDAGVPGVGHREWALHPRQQVLGSGSSKRAHALYVFGDWRPESAVEKIQTVAWPPAGYAPYRFGLDGGYPWSFQHHGKSVDHSKASVRMSRAGKSITIKKESGNRGLLVWYPVGLPRATYQNQYNKPDKDVNITVTISNLMVDGQARTFTYTVSFIDPQAVLQENPETDPAKPTDSTDPDEIETTPINPALNLPMLQNIYKGRTEQALGLLKQGADPNARSRGGWSALMYAAWFGQSSVVEALLKAKADPDFKHDGWNAAGLARYRKHEQIAQIIEARSNTKAMQPASRKHSVAAP
ncbi:MAG: ankyrin repeat domain-containing protein [Leptospiraceae bacterium]|nr:ankyrin repeat domain-containing protein [Leptospiraceae bacterium]